MNKFFKRPAIDFFYRKNLRSASHTQYRSPPPIPFPPLAITNIPLFRDYYCSKAVALFYSYIFIFQSVCFYFTLARGTFIILRLEGEGKMQDLVWGKMSEARRNPRPQIIINTEICERTKLVR